MTATRLTVWLLRAAPVYFLVYGAAAAASAAQGHFPALHPGLAERAHALAFALYWAVGFPTLVNAEADRRFPVSEADSNWDQEKKT